MLVVIGVYTLERMKVDDPVGAVSATASTGLGLISSAFSLTHLREHLTEAPFVKALYGVERVSCRPGVRRRCCCPVAFLCGTSSSGCWTAVMGIRVSPQEEIGGLDDGRNGGSPFPILYPNK
jgi:Amt family ammonium transporter